MHRRSSNTRPRDERNFLGWTGVRSNRGTEVKKYQLDTIPNAVDRREQEVSNVLNNMPIR